MSELHTPDDSTDLKLSFRLDPKEHVAFLFGASTPIDDVERNASDWRRWRSRLVLMAVGFAALVSLSPWFDEFGGSPVFPVDNRPLALPIAVVFFIVFLYWEEKQEIVRYIRRLAARIGHNDLVTLEFDRNGIRLEQAGMTLSFDWTAIRAINNHGDHIGCYGTDMMIYAPARAFADDKAFHQALVDIRQLWHHGRERALSQAETPTRR